ncbi:MAG: hypothetical protein DME42_08025, partial [Verrucomicrobia bacterium]
MTAACARILRKQKNFLKLSAAVLERTDGDRDNVMKTNLLLRTLLGLIAALCSVMSVQVKAGEREAVKYPRYMLIDLGTLGGPNSGQVFPARSLNNRGQLIALSATAVPDPECFQEDCYVHHAILQ